MPRFSPPLSDLDALYISYLNVLDKYTKLRAQQGDEFSSAFLSLAQARFRAPPATAHVGFSAVLTDGGRQGRDPRFGVNIKSSVSSHDNDKAANDNVPQIPLHMWKHDTPRRKKNAEKDEVSDVAALAVNPIHLFGLVTPTGLLDAQLKFDMAVGSAVKLVAVRQELLRLEGEIERVKGERGEGNSEERKELSTRKKRIDQEATA